MARLKTQLMAVGGLIVGIVTLRRIRNRRSESAGVTSAETEDVEQQTATEQGDAMHGKLETATDHAVAAVEHARIATSKAVETYGESDTVDEFDEDEEQTTL